jgi:hypothetical protein
MTEWIKDGKGYFRHSDRWSEEKVLKSQCEMFLWTSYLYYELDVSVWRDDTFDHHCKYLLDRYDRLPDWFTARVTRSDLEAGTGYAVAFTNDERFQAVAWACDVIGKQAEITRALTVN